MILTDSVFSMDGDIAPLDIIVELSELYGCITMIDEAHATGVLGEKGSGASEYFNVQKNRYLHGNTIKSNRLCRGYVAGSKTLIDFLKIEQDLLFLILHYQLRLYQQV